MAPQRLAQLPLVADVPTAAVPLTALLTIAAANVVNGANALLVIVLWIVFALDHLAGTMRAYLEAPPRTPWFDGDKFVRGFVKKALLFVGVLAAGAVDAAAAAAPWLRDLPEFTVTSTGLMAVIIIAQVRSIWRNVLDSKDAQVVALFIQRRLDRAQLGHEPPTRRHYDDAAQQLERELETPDSQVFHDAVRIEDRIPKPGA